MSKLLLPMLTVLSLFAAFPVVSASATVTFAGHSGTSNCPSGTVCSTNWSGFAVTAANGAVSLAKGSWIVPSVTCGSSNTYSSYWVGIDGYSSSTVEQTGTDSDCSSGHGVYYAWYEFYPNPSVQISGFTVHPGDVVTAQVSYSTSTGLFTTTITDGSQNFSTSGSVSGAARSSAEWIVERPALCRGHRCSLTSLSNFGSVSLGTDYTSVSGTNYATISGTNAPIGSFGSNAVRITMVNSSGKTLAEPSTLTSDGTSFTETWFASN
ncbi:MAG TPA: G1 family glutamic endopeptidase [Candidatus Bathyarchaeia archaeon]|nr:G1 family glutamic endopeptidase [Candidatus Bathyarchaeia archaeon]